MTTDSPRIWTASVLTIGDELLCGQVQDTNASWLAAALNDLGFSVTTLATVPDDEHAITGELHRLSSSTDIVIATGGLGPTPDDRTRDAAAAFASVPLILSEEILSSARVRFRTLGREMPKGSDAVAQVPKDFELLPNPAGTAPGLLHTPAQGGTIVLLPGVPHEMKAIFENHTVPRIRSLAALPPILHRTILTTGAGETTIQEKLQGAAQELGNQVNIAYLPALHNVRIRLTATGSGASEPLMRAVTLIQDRLGTWVYGMDDDTLESVVGRHLAERGLTVAVAESCTGGNVLHRLTDVPGASSYVMGGVVAYANVVKQSALGVDGGVLAEHGAVSETVALQMAEGVRARIGTSVGLSVTGVAGPSGGTPEKPVGTVWIGFAGMGRQFARRFQFGRNRLRNKERCVMAALDVLRRALLNS